MLTGQNGWGEQQSAVRSATSLKGAGWRFSLRLSAQRCSYCRLAQLLEQKYGTRYQGEVFSSRFRTCIRRRDCGSWARSCKAQRIRLTQEIAPTCWQRCKTTKTSMHLDSPHLKKQVRQGKSTALHEVLENVPESVSLVKSSLLSYREDSSFGFEARMGTVNDADKCKGTAKRWGIRRTSVIRGRWTGRQF